MTNLEALAWVSLTLCNHATPQVCRHVLTINEDGTFQPNTPQAIRDGMAMTRIAEGESCIPAHSMALLSPDVQRAYAKSVCDGK